MASSTLGNKQLVQVCVVVEDIARTAAYYREILGFDVPNNYQFTASKQHTLSTYMGQPSDVPAKFVSFPMGDVSFELLQPMGSGSVWDDYLRAHGPGIHHVTFNVPRTAAAVASLADYGFTVTHQGLFTGRGGMYTYMDTEKDFGVTLEFLEFYNGEPASNPPPFPADKGIGTDRIIQVGIVVDDIERAVARYRSVLGLPEPAQQETPGYKITEMTFRGQPSEATAKLAFFNMGQMQIELIEPDSTPSVWRDYLNDKGISTHHVAFPVKNTQKAVDHFAKHGIGVAMQGLYGDRSGMYTYMDSEACLGIIVELLESFPEKRP